MGRASPLTAITVLELANVISGPYAGKYLVDLGAEVIKVEMPVSGDPFRKWNATAASSSSSFDAINRGKKSITLDLKSSLGQRAIKELAREADVVIENFRPHTLDRLGLGFEDLKIVNPSIIYCSIIGLGVHDSRPVYDSIPFAQSGLWSQFTDINEPRPVGPGLADHLSGMNAAMAILAALLHRNTQLRAQHLQVSMLGACVAMAGLAIADYFVEHRIADNMSRPRTSQCYAFVCADKKAISIHLSTPPKFWLALVKAVGIPELAHDPRFLTKADRIENYWIIHDLLASVFIKRSRDDWLKILTEADVPVAPLLNVAEAIEDSTVKSLELFKGFGHGERSYVSIGFPANAPWGDGDHRLPPPRLGEHNLTVFGKLGYAESDVMEICGLSGNAQSGAYGEIE